MIITTLLILITIIVLTIGLSFLAIGGSIAMIFLSDIIVACFVMWFVFFRKKSKSKSK